MEGNREILFEESQRFRQWWIWFILFPINLLWVAASYQQLLQGIPFGDNPMPDTGLIIIAVLSVLVSFLILSIQLKTQVTSQGIVVQFFPFHWTARTYSWDELNVCYIRTYSPIAEYGGWGYRLGIFGKGMAWNISGNQGLQLEFANKKKLLIGTRKAVELDAVLQRLGKERKPTT